MDEETNGELGLVVLCKGNNPTIDIVAVHGLGANPAWAWIRKTKDEVTGEERKINWLKNKDMLPFDIPYARIMAFNYESKWIADAPKQGRFSCAEQLLTALDNQRKEERNYRNRPIIFIGHSFGGIVVEQALVNASMTASPFQYLATSTIGIVFLGTPHRGSPSSKWGEILARCGRSLGLGSDDRILKDLRENSEPLTDLLYTFTIWLFRMSVDVVCFYEEHETNYGERLGGRWKELVVEEKSACIDGHRKVGLPTDHLKINKFASREDPSYKYVYPIIKDMTRRAADKVDRRINPQEIVQDESRIPKENLDCQKALFSGITNPLDDLAAIRRIKGKRVEGTCEWLLVQEKYSEWLVGDGPQLLRLVGPPGIGKTMLSSFLVDEMEEKVRHTPQMTFAYYFCDNKDERRNTATAIIRGLLVQLLQQHPELFRHIQPKYDMIADSLFTNFDALWRILVLLVKDFSAGELYFLVDALDECEMTSRQAFLINLVSLSDENLNVKVLITCRPEPEIEDTFRGKKGSLYIRLDDISTDLLKFIDVRVKELAERKAWQTKEELTIKEALRENANSTFLWASFVLEDISRVKYKGRIKEKLRTLPSSLCEIYTRIIKNI